MIKIVIDSTCDLEQDIYENYDFHMIPLQVTLNNKTYKDKIEITVDHVYDAMRHRIFPQTSLPAPDDIFSLFKTLCQEGHDVIYLAFSSALSGTFQLASLIARDIMELFPNRQIIVLDSQSGSSATGLIALRLAEAIDQGKSLNKVLDQANDLIEHVQHIFTIDDLTWLVRGGRISRVKGSLGQLLNIKPILDVDHGTMEVIAKARGHKKSLHYILNLLEERGQDLDHQYIGISHADDLPSALEMQALIAKDHPTSHFMINKIGGVLGSHLGIGGVGLFFFGK